MSSPHLSASPWSGLFRERSHQVFVIIFTGMVTTAMLLLWIATRSPWAGGAEVKAPVVPTVPVPVPPPRVLRPPQKLQQGEGRVLATRVDGISVVPELAEQAYELNAADSTIERDFEVLDTLVEFYRHFHHGENPTGGENDEIVAQLTGHNPSKLAVLPPEHPAINARGELVDRWGTPFHFHPVNYEVLELMSAGPDGKLWTGDDVRYEPSW